MTTSLRRTRALVAGVFVSVAGAVGIATPAAAVAPGFNGRIAFTRVADGQEPRIFSVNPDGTGLTDLVEGSYPNFTADGSRIGYVGEGGLAIANADGTDPRQVVDKQFRGFRMSMSPDGSKFAFLGAPNGIRIATTDGAEPITLFGDSPAQEWNPAFSADGTRLIYSVFDGDADGVWMSNVDGSNAHLVVPLSDSAFVNASLSPDGSKIAYDAGGRIFVADSDGTDAHAVGPPGVGPAFSPDGEWLVFLRESVWVMRVDGSDARQITFGPSDGLTMADWQPLLSAPPNLPPRALGTAQNKLPLALFGNGAASFDGDGTIVKYEWRWGDHTPMTPNKFAWHRYARAGTYLVRLTVTDDDGAKTTKQAWVKVASA